MHIGVYSSLVPLPRLELKEGLSATKLRLCKFPVPRRDEDAEGCNGSIDERQVYS
jgi:hypothetical protein